jgi:hypothetical protein
MKIGELVRHKTALELGVDVDVDVGVGGSDTKCRINFDGRKQAIRIVAIAMVACSTVKVPVNTSSTPVDTGPAARVLLEDSLAAKGGKAKLERLRSLKLNGVGTATIEGKSVSVELTRVLVLPDKMRLDTTISFPGSPPVIASIAVSGDTGWQRLVNPKTNDDVSSDLVGSELQTAKFERWRDPELILLKAIDPSAKVMLLRDDMVAGGDLYSVVKLTSPFGNVDLFLYIDKKTKLLSRVISSDGHNTESDELSDYREVSGLQFAYKRDNKRSNGTTTLELKTVEVDPEIDLTLFDTATQRARPPAAAKSETAASAASTLTPAPWWCISFDDGEVGSCFVTQLQCIAARSYMVVNNDGPDEHFSSCTPQQDAFCFDAQNVASAGTETLCHPTFAICRSNIDRFNKGSRGNEKRVVSSCRAMSSTTTGIPSPVAGREDAPHWWCMSADHDRIGSCDRSQQKCEDGRGFVRRTWPASDVSDCAPQQSAVCFDLQRTDGSRRMECHPRLTICQSMLDHVKQQSPSDRRVLSDCHTVD